MVTTSEGITSSLAILVFLMVQGTAGSSLLQGIAEPAPPAPLAHSGAASSRSACAATVRCAARWPLTQASHRPTAPHSACCRSEQASSHMAHSGAACSRSACAATVRCAVRRPLAQAPHRPAASHSACCRSEQALSHSGAACSRSACAASVRCAFRRPLAQAPPLWARG